MHSTVMIGGPVSVSAALPQLQLIVVPSRINQFRVIASNLRLATAPQKAVAARKPASGRLTKIIFGMMLLGRGRRQAG
ncbi:MAG: hypothetical protein ACT4N3_10295 [Sphingosinicella sp.]